MVLSYSDKEINKEIIMRKKRHDSGVNPFTIKASCGPTCNKVCLQSLAVIVNMLAQLFLGRLTWKHVTKLQDQKKKKQERFFLFIHHFKRTKEKLRGTSLLFGVNPCFPACVIM